MLYVTLKARTIDTVTDLSEPERHVMQKLIAWERLGDEPAEFKRKMAKALRIGWDGRGPVRASAALRDVCDDLTARLAIAAGTRPGPGWLFCQIWPGRYSGGGLSLAEDAGPEAVAEVIDAADQPRGVLRLEAGQTIEQVVNQLRTGGEYASRISSMGLQLR